MGLQLIRQQKNECWITSLSMLTGHSLDALKKEFETIANMDYHAPFAPGAERQLLNTWFDALLQMSQRYGLSVQPGSTYYYTDLLPPCPGGRTRVNLTASLLYGKGMLTVRLAKMGHAVAFEDGKIFDPNFSNAGIPFKVWKSTLRGRILQWRIDRVV